MPDAMPTLNSEDAEQSLIKIIARSRQVILLRVRQKNGRGARDDFDKRTRKRRDTKRSANFASNGARPSETGTRVAWKKTLPDEVSVAVATRAGKLALRSSDPSFRRWTPMPATTTHCSQCSTRLAGEAPTVARRLRERNARRGLFVDQRRRRDGVGLLRNGQAGTRLPPRAVEPRQGMKGNERVDHGDDGDGEAEAPRQKVDMTKTRRHVTDMSRHVV
ncbi:hypothetical protein THAOC_14054 [Thalassiosira oceanica]|uniref:Uncharacterized protein n=1 Tax=Thalassiosira oceanica TaxID=159749 RepID=K0SIF8_THAOC|nr:hypothetical protein THAOC_14054 [Thalassiosira oceanica]|eukprot:EJK65130.1 hypothetical protein THAOC_14054 [Thalassiosira oceanica]